MKRIILKLIRIVFCIMVADSAAWSIELSIPAINGKAGQIVSIPVIIDQTDNLAGIKLVINYDTHILGFKKADKTEHTSSLMHVVNDKNPGKLIIVMAGAKGIKGKDFSIMSLTFEINKQAKAGQTTAIEIGEIQLMSEQLKDITATIKTHPLTVIPDSEKESLTKPAP